LELIDQTAASGIEIETWTFDENYGRDCGFLDGLDDRKCAYVGEVPPNFRVWIAKPKVLRKPPKNRPKCGKRYPRLAARDAKASSVKNLAKCSPAFTEQTPQRYRVTDSHKGPEIWEVQWHTCWRKSHSGKLVSSQCTLIVAKNVRTGEVKYFLSNRVPGRGGWTLRAILRVAFSRWKVEACFREAKKELGWDHFECRGWGCVHRHLIVTILSQLFCARMRHRLCRSEVVTDAQLLTLEQVRRAADVYLDSIELPRSARLARYQAELDRLRYHQTRNATASRSHRKTRLLEYEAIGIDVMKIKSVEPKTP
jgi:SRSO17 transposase